VADRNLPRKHVPRPRPVLLSADRLGVAAIARQAGIGRPAVWRWQRRYAEVGVDGLPRDRTRKPGKAPLDDALVRRIVADLRRAARGDHPLDRAGDGRGGGGLLALGASQALRPDLDQPLEVSPGAVDGRRRPPGASAGLPPANRPSPGPARRRACLRPRGRRDAARSPGEPSGPQSLQPHRCGACRGASRLLLARSGACRRPLSPPPVSTRRLRVRVPDVAVEAPHAVLPAPPDDDVLERDRRRAARPRLQDGAADLVR
jgi:Winged helix-turn helix